KDKRLRSSVLLSKNGQNIVIDCGPDFRQQILRANVRNLEAILFTHEHNDHVLGIDDTRSLTHFAEKPMDIYGTVRTLNEIKLRFTYAIAKEKYPVVSSFQEHIIINQTFHVARFKLDLLELFHGNLYSLAFLIAEKFDYITDASFLSEKTLEKIHNVGVLV